MFGVCCFLILLFTSPTFAYRLQCPDISQRSLRASSYCTNRFSWKYTCLFDTNRNCFSEKCDASPDYVTPGEKYVITRNLRNIDCFQDRYQPFPLWSNASGMCLYRKTQCEGEGQVTNNNGSPLSDRTCRCDFTKGFRFIRRPKQQCFCIPSEEDCSCYMHECPVGSTLSSDYKCGVKKENDDSKCPSIENKSTVYKDVKEKKVNITLVNSIKINLKNKQKISAGVLIMLITMIAVFIITERLAMAATVDIKHDKSCVAAIDFGTTYSGYAVCTRDEYQKNPRHPKMMVKKWKNGSYTTNKAPTCVLFDPKKKFFGFGFMAMNEFRLNSNEKDYSSWYYFEHFKIMLFKEKTITKETMLEESLNIQNPDKKKKMQAVDVFAAVISYFKDEIVQSKERKRRILVEDIHWVITVPAIWNLSAKQFMRDAAEKAGISRDNLTLALEPEAASVYCRKVPVSVKEDDDEGVKVIAAMAIGSKYVVLDQGGGTTDIAAYEVTGKNTLKEIHKPCGGQWGGITVKEEFNNFLTKLFGADVINEVKMKTPSDYYQLLYNFENTKTSFTDEHLDKPHENQSLEIPESWLTHFTEVTECTLSEIIKQTMFHGRVSVKSGKMRIKNYFFRTFFDYSIKHVVNEMTQLLKKEELNEVKTILIVGGHSNSTILTKAIDESFKPAYQIVIPKDPDIAVMKGAVLLGFNPKLITSRFSKDA